MTGPAAGVTVGAFLRGRVDALGLALRLVAGGAGLDRHEILGLRVPLVKMPVAPGRSITTLVEVAARNQLLRATGRHAARELAARVDEQLRQVRLKPDPTTASARSAASDGDLEDDVDIRDEAEDSEA